MVTYSKIKKYELFSITLRLEMENNTDELKICGEKE